MQRNVDNTKFRFSARSKLWRAIFYARPCFWRSLSLNNSISIKYRDLKFFHNIPLIFGDLLQYNLKSQNLYKYLVTLKSYGTGTALVNFNDVENRNLLWSKIT